MTNSRRVTAKERVEAILMHLPHDLFAYRDYLEKQLNQAESSARAEGFREARDEGGGDS